ncbi:hypothetical protein RRG08_022131 [Elysia crispata]|uniref:Uncharacterized protein n=1 Tax=Elysia crispata TaxID=231223 RepID=A0AAE1CQR9_9GAST|nr:hypothetical protein RRG08_022131 [Elysia crispata]
MRSRDFNFHHLYWSKRLCDYRDPAAWFAGRYWTDRQEGKGGIDWVVETPIGTDGQESILILARDTLGILCSQRRKKKFLTDLVPSA